MLREARGQCLFEVFRYAQSERAKSVMVLVFNMLFMGHEAMQGYTHLRFVQKTEPLLVTTAAAQHIIPGCSEGAVYTSAYSTYHGFQCGRFTACNPDEESSSFL